jgi:hypothetical protein
MKIICFLLITTFCPLIRAQGQNLPPTLVVNGMAKKKTYGLSEKFPIKVGGGALPVNVYTYLSSLRGPRGERIEYNRMGSCCGYKDPEAKGSKKEGEGVLTVFEVFYKGGAASKILYFDQYRYDNPLVIKGFKYQRPEDVKSRSIKPRHLIPVPKKQ